MFFVQGMNVTWFSTALPLFMSRDSPLEDGPITPDMAGLIGSLVSLGALIGCLIPNFVFKNIGHKQAILLCGIPIIVRPSIDSLKITVNYKFS